MNIPISLQPLHAHVARSISQRFLNFYAQKIRGPWVEFVWIRKYIPWDNLQQIDRKTTAKKNEMHTKQTEQHQLTLWFIADVQQTWLMQKMQEIIYTLGFAALKHGDRIWMIDANHTIKMGNRRENLRKMITRRWKTPASSSKMMQILRHLLIWSWTSTKKWTSLQKKIQQIAAMWVSWSLIVLISDDLSAPPKDLKMIAQKNKIVWIQLVDKSNMNLPKTPFVRYRSAQGSQLIQTSWWWKTFDTQVQGKIASHTQDIQKNWWIVVRISTWDNVVKKILWS